MNVHKNAAHDGAGRLFLVARNYRWRIEDAAVAANSSEPTRDKS
jgi:hypothetical protein